MGINDFMRTLFYILGLIIGLLALLMLFGYNSENQSTYAATDKLAGSTFLLFGMVYIVAGIQAYRGGWQFLLGLLLASLSFVFGLAQLSEYFQGRIESSFFVLSFIVALLITALAGYLLFRGHKKHLNTPVFASSDRTDAEKEKPLYRDLSWMSAAFRYLVVGYVFFYGLGFVSSLMQYQLIMDLQDKTFASSEVAAAQSAANDQRQQFLSRLEFTASLGFYGCFLVWTYRASRNAHALSLSKMNYTPIMAVVWNFIPIANIWHPYQAMKEIWQVSANPHNWKNLQTYLILPIWWFSNLISNGFGSAAVNTWSKAEKTAEMLAHTTILTATSIVFAIVWAISVLVLIQQIQRFQTNYIESQRLTD